ncbi:hypothetical protein OHU23_40685 (plasmid) [Streptomyces virginiae]|uniref:hypothetical protein n=1 Tax=Streptomyces virginiae TaxID=1961 RepID=UPI002F90F3A2
MLDHLCQRRRSDRVIADSRTAVLWVRASGDILDPDGGYILTMACDEAGPGDLYASALYGWAV